MPVDEAGAIVLFPELDPLIIDQSYMDNWAAEGVHKWVMGDLGETCTDVCAANNALCSNTLDDSVFKVIDLTVMGVLIGTYSSTDCNIAFAFDNQPYIPSQMADGNCLFPSPTTSAKYTCTGASGTQARLCACVAPLPVDPCPDLCGNVS